MGIVPWVPKAYAPETISASPLAEQTIDQPVAQPAISTPAPHALGDVKLWLPQQAVVQMAVRAGSQSYSGNDDAPLLVVVETADGDNPVEPVRSAFNTESAQLFELMMRAINMPLAKRKLCVLAAASNPDQPPNNVQRVSSVNELFHVQTKAVLLLVKRWDGMQELKTADDHHVRLEQPPLPVWRIPHPDLLIQQNQLKRQAWFALQALQSVL